MYREGVQITFCKLWASLSCYGPVYVAQFVVLRMKISLIICLLWIPVLLKCACYACRYKLYVGLTTRVCRQRCVLLECERM